MRLFKLLLLLVLLFICFLIGGVFSVKKGVSFEYHDPLYDYCGELK